jgi:hypothetical protein
MVALYLTLSLAGLALSLGEGRLLISGSFFFLPFLLAQHQKLPL